MIVSIVRVLVVDAAASVRARIGRILAGDVGVRTVGDVAAGEEALLAWDRLRPDVLILGEPAGGVDALGVVRHVMARRPLPILALSRGSDTAALLAAGVVDVVPTPDSDGGPAATALLTALRIVSRVGVVTHRPAGAARASREVRAPRPLPLAVATRAPARAADPPIALPEPLRSEARVVVIGASTGGPAAVADVLRALPATFPLPILLVIHLAPTFEGSLVRWLAGLASLPVGYARDGDPLPVPGAGRVFMAPPDRHLALERGRLRLLDTPPRHSCRPSVDVLFESVAAEIGAQAVGCLLTGMGRDGAEGLLALRSAGGTTLVQDQATSAVFGMPRQAIAIGAAHHVLPLPAIGEALRALGEWRKSS